MRKLLSLIVLAIVLIPTLALSAPATFEGTIQGYNCVTQGRTCPLGQEDPLAATESVFVLLTPDGKYYFVPNIDRAVMARHIAEQVQIVGELNPQYNSIRAQSLSAFKNGQMRTVWTPQMERVFSDPGIGNYPFNQP